MSKSFQIWDNFFPLLFPKDSKNKKKIKKKFCHWTSGSVVKPMFKWSKQMKKKICKNVFVAAISLFPKNSTNLKSLDIGLWEKGAQKPLNRVRNTDTKNILPSKAKFTKKQKQKSRGDFTPFIRTSFHIWDHFFPLLFPKNSKSLKKINIRLQEVWAKRRLNGTSKVNRRTDGRTDTHTDISTDRKNRPRGPILWKLCLVSGHTTDSHQLFSFLTITSFICSWQSVSAAILFFTKHRTQQFCSLVFIKHIYPLIVSVTVLYFFRVFSLKVVRSLSTALGILQCAVFSVQCPVFSVQCPVFSVQCGLYGTL